MQLSSFLQRFNEPETLKMAKLGRELRAKGIDIIDLSLGEPDFDTPGHIKEAAIKAINDNWSHYTPVPGFLDLREAVCTKLKRDNNLDYNPGNIVASTGAKQSLANAMLAIPEVKDAICLEMDMEELGNEKIKYLSTSKVSNIKASEQILKQFEVPSGLKIVKHIEEVIQNESAGDAIKMMMDSDGSP